MERATRPKRRKPPNPLDLSFQRFLRCLKREPRAARSEQEEEEEPVVVPPPAAARQENEGEAEGEEDFAVLGEEAEECQ